MAHENVGHRARMRERVMKEGMSNFQEHEVLEFLLFQYLPYKDTNKIAHNLLESFGSVTGVLDAAPEQLMTVSGVSEVTACNLTALKEVFVRYNRGAVDRAKLVTLESIARYAKALMGGYRTEKLIVVYVDHATCFKHSEEFTSDKIDKVHVEIKDIVATAVRINAAGVILFHCHVDGVCQPSEADRDFTTQLFFALKPIGVMLLEHIIFNGTDDYFSFHAEHLIDEIASKYKSAF